MAGKQVTELDALPSFTDTSLLPVHNGAGLKKGLLSQLANYLGTKFSNPNLLINPDFKINQRGSSTYTTTSESPIYTVDRWMSAKSKVNVNSNGTVTITSLSTNGSSVWFKQLLENTIEGACTLSCEATSVTGDVYLFSQDNGIKVKQGINKITLSDLKQASFELKQGASITLKWVKLEQGSIATPFVVPNYMEELIKCRYFYYQANVASEIVGQIGQQVKFNIPYLRMLTNPTAKISTDGDANKLILSDSTVEKVLSINVYRDNGNMHIVIKTDTNKVGVFSLSGNQVGIGLDSEIY